MGLYTLNGWMVGMLIISQKSYFKKDDAMTRARWQGPCKSPLRGELDSYVAARVALWGTDINGFAAAWGKEWRCKVGVKVLGWQWDNRSEESGGGVEIV